MRDIASKLVGMHANKHVLITVHGNVLQTVVVDVSRNAVSIVQDVHRVQVTVKGKLLIEVVLDVALKVAAHLHVSMNAIRTVWDGDVDLYAELMQLEHVKLIVG